MTTERPDRGARALGQGIAIGISSEPNGLGLTWNEAVTVGHRIARHLVGPGVFLPDGDESERLRRIEAAARAYLEAEWDADRAYAEAALRTALEPEGSGQG